MVLFAVATKLYCVQMTGDSRTCDRKYGSIPMPLLFSLMSSTR